MNGRLVSLRTPAIAPSILTADFGRLREQIHEAESGGADLIHLDVMDGHFVPNISFGPLVVNAVRQSTDLPLDTHLMIESPERYVDMFADAGTDMISIHVEATAHPHRVIQQIKGRGVAAGIAINPATPVSAIEELLPIVDLVLVMTVNPGFGGQSFIPESLDKISRLRQALQNRGLSTVRIEVDGGIGRQTIRQAADAGADMFVTGSSVFNHESTVGEALRGLREALADL